ncbi:hypothetical protein [Shinella sp.]|uniref:hypothetical protein n=1 Tax=Shinella sp. TaxID=1870904 RepID=UPI0029A5D730|nr:hypothetical protein [Shinella sp.]MDX3973293.1 hypothetical protein [Shinella sp.]
MARGPTTGIFTRSGRASRGKGRFASEVDEWVQQTEKRINAVFRLSTQKAISFMQQNVPVQDGFLRASLVVLVNQPPPKAEKSQEDGMGPFTDAYMQLQIASAVSGDRIVAAYTMEYARRLEYGFTGVDSIGRSYNQPPVGWTRLAAQQWKTFVREATAEAKARVASRAK